MSFPQLDVFLERHADAFRIAFSGGADTENDALVEWIYTFLDRLVGERIIVVTGGTAGGVPGIASGAARARRFPLLGVLPERGRKYLAPEFSFAAGPGSAPDVIAGDGGACCVIVPSPWGESTWGDAAPVFVGASDAIIAIGGVWGTAIELALALKVNESRLHQGDPPITILPAAWFPGVCGHLADARWMSGELRTASFQKRSPVTGPLGQPEQTAEYVRELMQAPRYRPAASR